MSKKKELTQEEFDKKFSEEYQKGEWKSASSSDLAMAKEAQLATRKRIKAERINVRLDPNDLAALKVKAEKEGIGYQTLLSSVLHQYVKDELVKVSEIQKVKMLAPRSEVVKKLWAFIKSKKGRLEDIKKEELKGVVHDSLDPKSDRVYKN